MTTATRPVTVEQFLAMEEVKPYRELIDGEIVEKAMPSVSHSNAATNLAGELRAFLKAAGAGRAFSELRCFFRPEGRVYLPDVCVFLAGRVPTAEMNPVETVPDFAIEVLSPDDRASAVLEKVQFYMRAGTKLLWVIDPERETVTAYQPGKAAEQFSGGATVAPSPVLPDFGISLPALFEG